MIKLRTKGVLLQIPYFDATIIGNGGEHGGSDGRPADIIDLLLQVCDLMTNQFGLAVFLVPNSDSPIVTTGYENRTFTRVPEGVASDTVDWSHMTIIVIGVSLREGGGAFVNGAVLSGNEVVVTSVVDGEIN